MLVNDHDEDGAADEGDSIPLSGESHRGVPLHAGQSFARLKVVRRDTINVPAGRFPAIVLQPTIKTNGLFSKNGHAEIWLSDDEHRTLLRMDTHFWIIKLGLTLKKVTYGTGAAPRIP